MNFLQEQGVPAVIALAIYVKAIKEGRAVLGYNQQHDGRTVRAELRHAGLDDMFEQTPTVCAMRSLTAAKIRSRSLNGKGGFPRLIDAAAHFGDRLSRRYLPRRTSGCRSLLEGWTTLASAGPAAAGLRPLCQGLRRWSGGDVVSDVDRMADGQRAMMEMRTQRPTRVPAAEANPIRGRSRP